MIYSPFLIIGFPLIFACLLTFCLYEVETGFFKNTFVLFSVLILLTLVMEKGLRFFKIKIPFQANNCIDNKKQNFYAVYFGFFVLFFCFIDLCVRGPILFSCPSSYSNFTFAERNIRYITIMCWSLIPIAFFCTKNKTIRTLFISMAILFPILAVDRNRMISSYYALFISFCILKKEYITKSYNFKNSLKMSCCLILYLVMVTISFSVVGNLRSSIQSLFRLDQEKSLFARKVKQEEGKNLDVNKWKNLNLNKIPLLKINATFLRNAPNSLIWLSTYATSSIFNFSVIHNMDYKDPEYLKYQMLHLFSTEIPAKWEDLTPLPLPLPQLNVGTEFFPFLLYGGTVSVLFSFMLVAFIYFSYLKFYSLYPSSIFLFLGFLKLSYCCLLLGFAPQFFTLTNLGFLILMISLHLITRSRWAVDLIELMNRINLGVRTANIGTRS
jgi:hypothetical protein